MDLYQITERDRILGFVKAETATEAICEHFRPDVYEFLPHYSGDGVYNYIVREDGRNVHVRVTRK